MPRILNKRRAIAARHFCFMLPIERPAYLRCAGRVHWLYDIRSTVHWSMAGLTATRGLFCQNVWGVRVAALLKLGSRLDNGAIQSRG